MVLRSPALKLGFLYYVPVRMVKGANNEKISRIMDVIGGIADIDQPLLSNLSRPAR
jgi:hypothetical protein